MIARRIAYHTIAALLLLVLAHTLWNHNEWGTGCILLTVECWGCVRRDWIYGGLQ